MEILIPGLILVGLMVYASTKIKESAAMAYDEEVFETDAFSITKPEGFLIPVEFEADAVFEAFTKDFGVDEGGDTRKARAVIRFHNERTCDELAKELGGISVGVPQPDDITLTSEKDIHGATLVELHRLRSAHGGVFHLQIDRLDDGDAEVAARVNTMADSFTVN